MKLEYEENDYGLWITLKPETPDEVAQLARYALNAKLEAPEVYLSFYKSPELNLSLRKIKSNRITKALTPKRNDKRFRITSPRR